MNTTLLTLDGMFGPIRITESEKSRQLLIGHQIQGGAFMDPAAGTAAPRLVDQRAPGPVSQSAYVAGWLAAGSQNETGSCLMLGLGSGTGAVSLLYNFPNIDLTVVEIDPAVIKAACEFFPLLAHYLDEGRLQICTSDAVQYLMDAVDQDDQWDVGLADTYTGDNTHHAPDELVSLLADRCQNIWSNCIDSWPGQKAQSFVDILEACGKPARWLMRSNITCGDVTNLIITTQDIDPYKADNFIPYPELDGINVDVARYDYTKLIQHAVPIKPLDCV